MSSKEALTMGRRYSSSDTEESHSNTQHLLGGENPVGCRRHHNKRGYALLAGNIFVLLLNVGVLLMVAAPKRPQDVRLPHDDWIAPARKLELQKYDDRFGIHGPFRGPPRPELDKAWEDLIGNYTVRVPAPGWIDPSSPDSRIAEWQDEMGGYMATFSFLHNVHCLKAIRQWMLPEYYPKIREMYPSTPEEPLPDHLDHCIDIIRQSELCHADMALLMFEWSEENERPISIHGAPHVCANLDRVNHFLEANSVPPFGSVLENPFTGEIPWPT